MIPLLTIALAALGVLGATQPSANSAKKLAAQQLFQKAISARDSLPLERYIQRLEEVTKFDGKFAEAFHELGRAYMERDNIDGRNRALLALERAIQLAPRNKDYHYTLALLHLKRDMRGAAASEFRKMMKIDPADARPYYHLALFKEEDMLHYRDMVSLHEDAIIYFYEFAEEDFAEAERLLRTAIVLDPKMIEAYYRLASLYYEAQRYEEMAALLEQGISHQASSDLYLFLGLARHELGNSEGAMADYEQALQKLSPADREFFYSLQPILSPDSAAVYKGATDSAKAHMQRRFWKTRDPLFLTAANERLLEHFGRIAYANLRYSFPEKKIEGWKTDRGKTLIRFGQPRWRVRTRADLGISSGGHTTLKASREIWDYGDFRMSFEDRFLNRNYAFAWGGIGETDGKWLFENKIREVPERYTFPHGGQRLNLPHVIAQFRGAENSADSTLLEIYFGIPDASLAYDPESRQGRRFALRRGLFLFDENWNEIRQWRDDRTLFYPAASPNATITAMTGANSSAGANYLIDRWPVRMPPGAYYLSLEVMDRKSGHSGAERERLVVENFAADRLSMSSVILAGSPTNTLEPKSLSRSNPDLALYTKGEISIVPSLFRQFSPNTPIYVYYEVYNLTLDTNSQTHYRIDNIVEPRQESKGIVTRAVGRIGQLFGWGGRPVSITSSFESTGNSRTEKIYHSLEILGRRTGEYHLTIQLTDLVSGQSTSRQVAFKLIDHP